MIGANDAGPSVVTDPDRSCGTGSGLTFNGRTETDSEVGTPGVGEGAPAEGGVWGALINVDCSQEGVASPALGEFGLTGLLKLSTGEEDGISARVGCLSAPDRALIGDGRPMVDASFSSGLVNGDEFPLPNPGDRIWSASSGHEGIRSSSVPLRFTFLDFAFEECASTPISWSPMLDKSRSGGELGSMSIGIPAVGGGLELAEVFGVETAEVVGDFLPLKLPPPIRVSILIPLGRLRPTFFPQLPLWLTVSILCSSSASKISRILSVAFNLASLASSPFVDLKDTGIPVVIERMYSCLFASSLSRRARSCRSRASATRVRELGVAGREPGCRSPALEGGVRVGCEGRRVPSDDEEGSTTGPGG